MNILELYKSLYGDESKTASDKTATTSKLAQDVESLYAAGQIFGAATFDGLLKRAADLVSNNVDTKAETGKEPYSEDTGGRGSMIAEVNIPEHDSAGPTGKEEASVKHITQTDPAISGPSPDDVEDGEATEGSADGTNSHPGIKSTLKSLKDSFDSEVQ